MATATENKQVVAKLSGSKDRVVSTRNVYATKDYSQFKVMGGNRDVNDHAVGQLVNLMVTNGNLTLEYPITVNEHGFVIDGQHRLAALKELKWEVGYIVMVDGGIEQVRAINRGGHNWSWRDIASSYSNLGNKNYEWFIHFVDRYALPFSPALIIAGGKNTRRNMNAGFQGGDFVANAETQAHAEKVGNWIQELREITDVNNVNFVYAAIAVTRTPLYDHKRMVEKIEQMNRLSVDKFPSRGETLDYQRAFEETFNYGYQDENKVRLF